MLGALYFLGRGVLQDYVLSHMWINLPAASYSASENRKRDKAIELRDTIAREMTTFDISKAQRLAREWVATFEKRKKK
jgi:hypothetical protein